MKSPRSTIFHLIAASIIITAVYAEPSAMAPDFKPTYPEPVFSPAEGRVHKEKTESKNPRALLSDLPVRPTREQLMKANIGGMLLYKAKDKQSGANEERLATALKAHLNRKDPEDASQLGNYIAQNPDSPWTPGLRVTYGRSLYHQGRFSEALAEFEGAWNKLKGLKDESAQEVVVSAAAELAGLYARLGKLNELREVLKEIEARPVSGENTEKIRMAAEGLESMTERPEHSFKCGPYALANLRKELGLTPVLHPCIEKKASTVDGVSLADLEKMAAEMKMDWVAAERGKNAALPLPALVHWKVGHYAAVLKKTDDGRFLVHDPTFLHDFLITPEVLAQESSGNFLVPSSAVGRGWTKLNAAQAEAIWGKGAPGNKDEDDEDNCPKKNCGMADYAFDFYKAGLVISDTPLGYSPGYGPDISFHLIYRQRSQQVLDASSYGFGPKWTSNWSSYLQRTDSAGNMVVFLPGGGRETHTLVSGQFTRQKRSFAQLVKTSTSPEIYELQQPDGSKMVFSRQVNTGGYPKFLLTSFADPQNNTVQLAYDASNRLTTVTDALGQVSDFSYENPSFPHLVTKISDPFIPGEGERRSAIFSYNSTGRLVKITDAIGIESSFTYNIIQPDFIASMTTPYGTTTFVTNPATSADTFVEVTDPLLRKERVEYRNSFQGILPGSDPANESPDTALIQIKNNYLYYGVSLYWDKKTYVHNPPNPTTGLNYDKASQTKWMWHSTVVGQPIGVVQCTKKPFESRIWYEYPGQVNGTWGMLMGSSERPSKIGRRVSATETQVDQYLHNDKGMPTQHTDPLGRVTKSNYDTNGIDVLSIQQKNGGNWETLQSFTYDPADPPRAPRAITDAAGQTTTLAWNARGQILSVTAPGNLVTTWNYNPTSGFLESIDGPLAGTSDRTSFTPDLYGRVRTVTEPGAYTLTMDYDALDRPTQVTYPDDTTEQFSYQRGDGTKILDLTHHKDRENRWTFFGYNALRQRTATLDPLFRATRFNWCYCGSLQDLWDAEGNKTHWDYDISARLLKKTYADGTEHSYTYDLAGRLQTVTDAKNQVKTHSYFTDGQLKQITYTASQIPTPNVSFTYDPIYGRLATMTDGTGITSYAYHPVDGSTFGAGNLHTIDGPLAADTIAHTYDALGRTITQSINGPANTTTIDNYDALGRVTQFTNPLGVFTQTYDPVNLMPKTVTAPNGLTTTLDYHTAAADLRLKEIKHTLTGNAALSKHIYTYKPAGNIKSWEQTLGTNPAKTWAIAYDKADQLEAATLTDSAAVFEQHAFRYDKIGNRTSHQNGPQISQSAHNNRNQITSDQPGGWMRVRGTTDEPAAVRVKSNANPFNNAATDDTGEFSAWVQAAPGDNTLTIEAKDFSPNANTHTNSWSVNITGQNRVPSYDLNGNTTTNGTGQTYEWDAENRLVKITYADLSSTEFSYDGFSRRIRITEKNSSNTITSDNRYLWAGGSQPAEERAADGTTVLKQYHSQGEYIPAASAPLNKLFYTQDHLGSIRELTDANGTLQTRYDYDMWGKRTKLSGTVETDVGYTGHHHHAKSGLVLTWFRAYDAEAGRWLSADPIGEAGGLNLYAYVGGNPLNFYDPDGRIARELIGGAASMGFGYLSARLTGQCYSAKDAALDFGSGALGLGAIGNGVKAYKAFKNYRRVQKMFVPELRGAGLAPDAMREGGKALLKGAGGFGLGLFKDGPGTGAKCKDAAKDLLDDGKMQNADPPFGLKPDYPYFEYPLPPGST